MSQLKKENIKNNMRSFLEKNAKHFPFIYQNCEIEVRKPLQENKKQGVSFGNYGTNGRDSESFYKPISKIVNFSVLDDE